VAQCVYLAASFFQNRWIFDPNGETIATDFVNVWASGSQALDGHPAAAYDAAIHKQAEVAALDHPFDGQYPWIYPPTFFFVAALLALLPFIAAYAAWMALTFSAYVATVRAIVGGRAGILLACAYPGILSNLVAGQNGYLTAALVGGSLLLIERSPMLAGCLIGLLSFKPHLGILFPLALIAGRQWRVLAAAAATTALLAVASACAFGLEAWQAFVESLLVQASEGFDSIAPGRFSEDPLGSRLGGNESLFFAHLY
jgi:arabinofuranan 3-O-arabinosyltransferase